MNNKYRLIRTLLVSKIGRKLDFEGIKIKVIISENACEGCVFATEEKAESCTYQHACMAHLRRDRNSVIFATNEDK